jgi:hypothetical protein
VLMLSLGVWVFFDLTSAPLDTSETTVIVGICFVLVFLGRTAWSYFAKTRKKHE